MTENATPRTDAELLNQSCWWTEDDVNEMAKRLKKRNAELAAAQEEVAALKVERDEYKIGAHEGRKAQEKYMEICVQLTALNVERDAWKEFAQHQFWCADCAESVLSCDVGSKLQEAAIEKERKNG